MRAHIFLTAVLAGLSWAHPLPGAEPAAGVDSLYYDEGQMRYLHLRQVNFGTVEVEVRFAGEPGSDAMWLGSGQKSDKMVTFARVVGEGEDRGTFFAAEVSDSKVGIGYKPGQKNPQDAGINGTYRRVSESKRLQLAKKEFEQATDRLVTALKAAPKAHPGKERNATALWKDQWPTMRQAWMDIHYKPVANGPPPASAKPAAFPAKDTKPGGNPEKEKDGDYWSQLARVTAYGYRFVETMPDPKTGSGWDGEYDDFYGGHVSLRQEKDGRLRANLAYSRAGEAQTGDISAVASAEKVTDGKSGDMTAEFEYRPTDPEAAEAAKPAAPITVRLTKWGRYIQVQVTGATQFGGRGWFDGIYRGGPVPTE